MVLTGLLLSACAPVSERVSSEQVAQTPAATVTPQDAVAADEVLFLWQGELPDGACGRLTVHLAGNGEVSDCSDAATMPWLPSHETEWRAIYAHFGMLMQTGDASSLLLKGKGDETGDEWAQALGVWARHVIQETRAGRTTAAGRTVLAWQHDSVPGRPAGDPALCGRLLVLGYGYAYALVEPCAGGQSQPLAEGWLITDELQQLRAWTAAWAPVYQATNYLDGQGSIVPSAEEIGTLNDWTLALYARLAATPTGE